MGLGLSAGALIAFGFALIIRLVPESAFTDTIGGALLFDGAAVGFVPDLYGQTGDALTFVAAALLWTFGCNAVTELVVEQRSTS